MAKSAEAFRTISEAAEELGVAQHVLRFWETRFTFVKPMKRTGGRRFYRPADMAVLATIRRLLHDEGYTIKGVQKLSREGGLKPLLQVDPPGSRPADGGRGASGVVKLLEAAKANLDRVLGQRTVGVAPPAE